MVIEIGAGNLNFLLGLLAKRLEEDELTGVDTDEDKALFDKLIQVINKQERAAIIVAEPQR